MPKPSLMELLQNAVVTRFDIYTGEPYNTNVRDFVIHEIDAHLASYKILLLSDVTKYIDKILTDDDIINIKFEDALRDDAELVVKYDNFEDTPLFKRLQLLKAKKLTLKNLLHDSIVFKILSEIKEAVLSGFGDEMKAFKLEGFAGYPNFYAKPVKPMFEYCTVTAHIVYVNTIKMLCSSHTDSMKEKVDYYTQHKMDVLINKKDLAKKILRPIDLSIKNLKEYLAKCLQTSYSEDINYLKVVLDYIVEYNINGQSGVNLTQILSFKTKLSVNIIFIRLYEEHGKDFLELDIVAQSIPLIIKNSIENDDFLSAYIILNILNREDMLDYFRDIVKLVLHKCTTHFVLLKFMISEDPELFIKLINKHCYIEDMISIANMSFLDTDDFPINICYEIGRPEFSKLILERMKEAGRLSEIKEIIKYLYIVSGIDYNLALQCALIVDKVDMLPPKAESADSVSSLTYKEIDHIWAIPQLSRNPLSTKYIRLVLDDYDEGSYMLAAAGQPSKDSFMSQSSNAVCRDQENEEDIYDIDNLELCVLEDEGSAYGTVDVSLDGELQKEE